MGEPNLRLFGVQDGPDGFVHLGSPYHGWWDEERHRVAAGPGPGVVRVDRDEWESPLHLCVFGGQFAAKTTTGAFRWQKHVVGWPESRGLIVVPTLAQFRENVLPVIEAANRRVGILRGRDWDYVANRNTIEWWNGCSDFVHSAEARILGTTVSRGWIDEGAECPYQAFLDTISRIRPDELGGVDAPLWFQNTTTGGGRANWATQVWCRDELTPEDLADSPVSFEELEDVGLGGRWVQFRAKTIDNPFGGQAYYEKMVRLYGHGTPQMRRYLEGDPLVGLEGLMFPQWDRAVYMKRRSEWPSQPNVFAAGADFGSVEPSAIPVWGFDGRGRYFLVETFYRRGMDPQSLSIEGGRLYEKYGLAVMSCDHAPEWLRALRERVPVAVRANKHIGTDGEVSYGIGLMNAILNKREPVGTPSYEGEALPERAMVYVDPEGPGNREWVREIETYMRKRKRGNLRTQWSEEPEDANNHAMDATRYCFERVYRMGLDPDLRRGGTYDGRTIETRMRR